MLAKTLKLRSEKGQSLVELALILPILIVILFGIIEFGRVFHSYLVITHAAREGARYGIICKDAGMIKGKVEEVAVGIDLEPEDITINPTNNITPGIPLTVTVNHEIELLTPVLADILPNPIQLTATSTMRAE